MTIYEAKMAREFCKQQKLEQMLDWRLRLKAAYERAARDGDRGTCDVCEKEIDRLTVMIDQERTEP